LPFRWDRFSRVGSSYASAVLPQLVVIGVGLGW
jgi:hypothetical protein